MKRKYVKILLTSIFCSCALTANAFDYVSKEAGFAVTVPDQNIMVVGENLFAVENRVFDIDKQVVKTNGIHVVSCITEDQMQKNFGKVFTTEAFYSDLNDIAKSSKKTKSLFADERYKYLQQAAAGAYINYTTDANDYSELHKLNEQLSNVIEINKIAVENINGSKVLKVESEIKNIGLSMKLPVKQSKEAQKPLTSGEEQGIKYDFADDGYMVLHFDNLYSIKELTYLLSANNNLYAVTSIYPTMENLPEMENLYQLDHKSFIKLNKNLVRHLKFTDIEQRQDNLVIADNITGRNLSLPTHWLYTQTDLASMYDLKNKGIYLTAYNALPETSLQAANDALQTFGINFDADTKTFMMDLSQFSMHDLLNFIDEGVLMVSGNLNSLAQLDPELASYTEQYKNIFNTPDLTKFMFDKSMVHLQNVITSQQAAAIAKYLKVENLTYSFDINHYNGRFNCDADIQTNLPDIFKLLQQEDFLARSDSEYAERAEKSNMETYRVLFSVLNDNLVPFNCYVKNQLYFNRSRHFNNLLYFTKGTRETANKEIMQQFTANDLYIY